MSLTLATTATATRSTQPANNTAEIEELCRIWVDDLEPLVGLPGDPRRAGLPVALQNVLAAVDGCFDAVGALLETGPHVAAIARAGQDLQQAALAMLMLEDLPCAAPRQN